MIKFITLVIGFFFLLPASHATVETLDAEINSEQVVIFFGGVRLQTGLTTLTRNRIMLSVASTPADTFLADSSVSQSGGGSGGSEVDGSDLTDASVEISKSLIMPEDETFHPATPALIGGELKLSSVQPEIDIGRFVRSLPVSIEPVNRVSDIPELTDGASSQDEAFHATASKVSSGVTSLMDLFWLLLLVIIMLICYNRYKHLLKSNI